MSKGIKILIVEDDENLRFLVVHRLKAEGYDVLETGDGEHAVKTIMSEKPDIVLLDWMLPGKQGAEVCKTCADRGLRTW